MEEARSYRISQRDRSAQIVDWRDRAPSDDWIDSFLQTEISLSGKSVLDCGCGFGYYGSLLAARGAVVDGLDREDECLAGAAKRRPPYRHLYKSCIEDLDHHIGCYDLILMRYVLHHIPRPVRHQVLSDIGAHLADKGQLVIETSFMDQMARHFDHQIFPELQVAQRKIYPTREELHDLLSDAGFSHVREVETTQRREPHPSVEDALERSSRLVSCGDGPTGWLLLSEEQRIAFHDRRSKALPLMFGTGSVPRVWIASFIVCER